MIDCTRISFTHANRNHCSKLNLFNSAIIFLNIKSIYLIDGFFEIEILCNIILRDVLKGNCSRQTTEI